MLNLKGEVTRVPEKIYLISFRFFAQQAFVVVQEDIYAASLPTGDRLMGNLVTVR